MAKSNETSDQLPMEKRLAMNKYNAEDCNDAIHGTRIPKALGLYVHQLCTIRGIRHHYGFAQELRGVTPEFTRTLNARDIMSGIIPTISQPHEAPYCFWYPEVPREDTLRALVRQYPDMLYQAARVCAIAGYFDLYKELDPLPEVHIAEEAGYASMQESNNGSRQIHEHILSQPLKFEIMNDYTRTVNVTGRQFASLNGDTAVYPSLTARSKYYGPREIIKHAMPWNRFCSNPPSFNITEDWGIDDHDYKAPKAPEDYVPLVYSPLPADLPLINKDKLIYVAAYYGDIDRYARLRRPQMLEDEWAMVVHGIYHNAIFAKWWTTQIAEQPEDRHEIKIRCAINARRIMSDDLTWLMPDTPATVLPELIWYPDVAHYSTYEKLAHRRPDMFETCLRACIVIDCSFIWDDLLNAAPDIFKSTYDSSEPGDPKLWWLSKHASHGLWKEARSSPNKHFQNDISAAVPDAAQKFQYAHGDWWGDYTVAASLYSRSKSPSVNLYDPVQPGCNEGPYDGMGCGIGGVDLALFLGNSISRETWKKEVEDEEEDENLRNLLLYKIWDLLELEQTSR